MAFCLLFISGEYCVHESKLEVLLCHIFLSSLVMSCVLVGKGFMF
jgi:hypothetical protein